MLLTMTVSSWLKSMMPFELEGLWLLTMSAQSSDWPPRMASSISSVAINHASQQLSGVRAERSILYAVFDHFKGFGVIGHEV